MKKYYFTIRRKTVVFILLFAIVQIALTMGIYANVLTGMNNEYYDSISSELSGTVAKVVDVEQFVRVRDNVLDIYEASEEKIMSSEWGSDAWNAYTARFDVVEQSEDFQELRSFLRGIQDVNTVECLYLVCLDPVLEKFIYVVDAAEDDACPPGCLDEIYDVNRDLLEDPALGFAPYRTDTEEYGELVTAGAPIFDAEGQVVGYAMTDVSLATVRARQTVNFWRLCAPLLLSLLAICIIGMLIVNKIFIKPINKLKTAASMYQSDHSDSGMRAFSDLDIRTQDEIEDLADAMKGMEKEINDKITELTQSQRETNRMTELANKDGLTGVRNKTAYNHKVVEMDQQIKQEDKPVFGIAMIDLNDLKSINDIYGHRSGDAAIIKLCTLVCATFVHSPVFRIGGDEFVVFMQNVDYRNADQLIREFNARQKELQADDSLSPAEKVSAAIGYAVYDPETDSCVQDVFSRADEAMYACKRSMKSRS